VIAALSVLQPPVRGRLRAFPRLPGHVSAGLHSGRAVSGQGHAAVEVSARSLAREPIVAGQNLSRLNCPVLQKPLARTPLGHRQQP
jgi:hypothetical protein